MKDIQIIELKNTDAIPYHLLLRADPSKEVIDKYIFHSTIYKADLNGQTIGCYVVCEIDKETSEIKNIVIDEQYQGKGIGTFLLRDAIERSKSKGAKKLIIGTGNSSVGQLYLYQKVGFRITDIKTDFFTKNYPEKIMENGIECRDMVILTKEF